MRIRKRSKDEVINENNKGEKTPVCRTRKKKKAVLRACPEGKEPVRYQESTNPKGVPS